MAELARTTRLAQPRVSTHLAKLREAGLVADRRDGVSVYYRPRIDNPDTSLRALWQSLRDGLDDPQIEADAARLPDVLASRHADQNWADAVAGDMERRYSPGRSWEATARALVRLLKPGRVIDIASGDGLMGELLHASATSIDCVDVSPRVVEAGRKRVHNFDNVHFHEGDMHALPFDDQQFNTVLLLHALTYSREPEKGLAEAARLVAPGGRLLVTTLKKHRHRDQVKPYGHVNYGFKTEDLRAMVERTGLNIAFCEITSVEKKTPNFEIITLLATKS